MIDVSGNGEYSTPLFLTSGKYEYKFVVNGEYLSCASECPNWEENEIMNAILKILRGVNHGQ